MRDINARYNRIEKHGLTQSKWGYVIGMIIICICLITIINGVSCSKSEEPINRIPTQRPVMEEKSSMEQQSHNTNSRQDKDKDGRVTEEMTREDIMDMIKQKLAKSDDDSFSPSFEQDHYVQLECSVTEATYSQSQHVILIISSDPKNVAILFDASSDEMSTIQLNSTPTCISVGLDDRYAAVGLRNAYYLINIVEKSVFDRNTTTYSINDIELGTDHVYLFYKKDYRGHIHDIDLKTGRRTLIEKVPRSGAVMKLHNSQKYLYFIRLHCFNTA